jgi:hypothetical protein
MKCGNTTLSRFGKKQQNHHHKNLIFIIKVNYSYGCAPWCPVCCLAKVQHPPTSTHAREKPTSKLLAVRTSDKHRSIKTIILTKK